ncbi:COG1470 family protein [Microbacterium album]|uniref:COG1470 family protein n=1 Tax=Microbacterium album TaxID=2053191 RepID=UPI0016697C9E|nr:hypothetical protein [Microbacterium album]
MRTVSSLIAAAAAFAVLLTSPLLAEPAVAATEEGPVTWSVRPGDENGEDGRSWVEWEAEPGEVLSEHMVVTNHSRRDVEFRLTSADGYFTETGRFNMLAGDQVSVAAGTWIDLPESVVVPAGASEAVPFTVTVPDDAGPGDHPAGVAASIRSAGDGTLGVESRVGFRVMTRVTGDLVAQLSVAATGAYAGMANPFEAGSVDIAYEVSNTGNTRLRAQPEISLSGPFGIAARTITGEQIGEIAPGETRRGVVRVPSVWPLFTYDVTLHAQPEAVSDDLDFDEAAPATAQATFLAMPWSQLATLGVGALLLTWTVWRRRHEKQKTERLIEQARAEALAGASAGPPQSAASAQPAATPPPSRRAARTSAGLALIGLLAAGQLLQAPVAQAADGDSRSGVDLNVEITPEPTPEPPVTPPATPPAPEPEPTHGVDCVSAPAPAAAQLHDDNRGALRSSTLLSVPQGGTITAPVGRDYVGELLCGWLFSSPTSLGSDTVTADGSVTFTVPIDAPTGMHRLVITDTSGTILAWTEATVTPASAPSPAPSLPLTGGQIAWGVALGAVALIVLGGMLTATRRRTV